MQKVFGYIDWLTRDSSEEEQPRFDDDETPPPRVLSDDEYAALRRMSDNVKTGEPILRRRQG